MRPSKYTKELLEPITTDSQSLAQVLKKLELRPTGGNYRMLTFRLRLHGIATDHLKGKAWARGETAGSHQALARVSRSLRRPDEEVFVANSPELCGHRLARRLRKLGRKYECQDCGIAEWRGHPLRLHVDHINGVNNDNRLDNLRFLCPNCHSLTETYCGRNARKSAR